MRIIIPAAIRGEIKPFETVSGNTATAGSRAKMKAFEALFQKTFRRYNLIYNKQKHTISCKSFPFEWTNFEYSGSIKISFLSASSYNYKKFRQENISEFNALFSNHKTYWSYPYDSIRICGNEAANGINFNDINAQVTYTLWLIKEVIAFFEPKERVLLQTPLYRLSNKVHH